MGVASAAAKSRGAHAPERQRKSKLMRLSRAPDNQDDLVESDQQHADPAADDDALTSLTSESLQHVLGFLAPRDRFALLSTSRKLAAEPLATAFASFCGRCAHCLVQNTHLCHAPSTESAAASFWACLLQRCGAAGIAELRVAACNAFSAEMLQSVGPATLATALANLQVLDLNRCGALGTEGLRLLADNCSSLRELRLRDMVLDPATFAQLVAANRSTLRIVDLEGCHTLTSSDARNLGACTRLEQLSLAGCHNVDNSAIADVVRACPQLSALNLRFCHKVDDVLVEKIAGALPKLRTLNLRYCMKVTDVGVHVICDRLPRLRALDLSQCSKITDAAVGRIVDTLKSLKDLRLWACGKLTSAAVQAISQASPSLEIVDIRSRNRVEAVIGGRDGLQLLVRKRSRASLSGGPWEPADEVGVFKRLPTCAVAA